MWLPSLYKQTLVNCLHFTYLDGTVVFEKKEIVLLETIVNEHCSYIQFIKGEDAELCKSEPG